MSKKRQHRPRHHTREQRANEREQRAEARRREDFALQRSNAEAPRRFARLVKEIHAGRSLGRAHCDEGARGLNALFNAYSRRKQARERDALRDLLLRLQELHCRGVLEDQQLLAAVARMAGRARSFLREPASWTRVSYNTHEQLASLARHLFAVYPVPRFMDECWLDDDARGQTWFLELGTGRSPRKLSRLPMRMTKAMVAPFQSAPESYSIQMALRYAQACGMGARPDNAAWIATGPLGRNGFENETFWESVVRFFVDRCPESEAQLNEIVDYLGAKVREDSAYSLKGRTLDSLQRQSRAWHAEQARLAGRGGRLVWDRCDIGEFACVEGRAEKEVRYSMIELRSSRELYDEGRRMNHCVGAYAPACYQGHAAIFSLRACDALGNREILATVEVHRRESGCKGAIVQAKARFNGAIDAKAEGLIRTWARQEDLRVRRF